MDSEITSKIQLDEITKLAQKLIRIPSDEQSGEQEICEYLSDILKSLGMNVRIQQISSRRANVIAEISKGNNKKSIMFNGHLDTVPIGDINKWKLDPLGGIIKGKKLYGRGSTDMKGAIASMIIAIKNIIKYQNNFSGKIIFTGVMGEETTGLGTQKIIEDKISADIAIVGEPSDGNIYRAHKGTMWFNITTYGKLGHSSESNSKSNNAIINMTKIIREIEKISKELEKKENKLLGHPSINIGLIKGGTKQNMIPDSCTASIDRRTLPNEKPKEIILQLNRRLNRLYNQDNRLKFSIKQKVVREAVEISESEPIVQELKKSIMKVCKKEPIISGMKATTDMSILVNQGKIPSVIYGPGFLKQAHTIDEFIKIDTLLEASKVYATLITKTLTNK